MEIRINHLEFTEELKSAVVKILHDIINQCSNLNLSSLALIVIPNDYGSELIEFQKQHGLRVGYTDNGLGIGVGKTLSYTVDERLISCIFLNANIIAGLFDENIAQDVAHIIHHELCHVHDDTMKFSLFGVDDIEKIFFGLSDFLRQVSYAHADLSWSEYIATRLSFSSMPKNHHMYVQSFSEAIPETLNRCIQAKKDYNQHLDVTKLFGEIQIHSSYLIKTYSYFLGYCHSVMDSPPSDIIIQLTTQFPYLTDFLSPLSDELKILYQTYEKWTDYRVFERLSSIIIRLWNNLGIHPSNVSGNQTFIGVSYEDYNWEE
jgi:hypothetical protein